MLEFPGYKWTTPEGKTKTVRDKSALNLILFQLSSKSKHFVVFSSVLGAMLGIYEAVERKLKAKPTGSW